MILVYSSLYFETLYTSIVTLLNHLYPFKSKGTQSQWFISFYYIFYLKLKDPPNYSFVYSIQLFFWKYPYKAFNSISYIPILNNQNMKCFHGWKFINTFQIFKIFGKDKKQKRKLSKATRLKLLGFWGKNGEFGGGENQIIFSIFFFIYNFFSMGIMWVNKWIVGWFLKFFWIKIK